MAILVFAVCMMIATPILCAGVPDHVPIFRTRAKPVLAGNKTNLAGNRIQYFGKAPRSNAGRLFFRSDNRDRKRPARR
jgi:hypothetical protein